MVEQRFERHAVNPRNERHKMTNETTTDGRKEQHFLSAYCTGNDETCGCGVHGYLRQQQREGATFEEALRRAHAFYDKAIQDGRASQWR